MRRLFAVGGVATLVIGAGVVGATAHAEPVDTADDFLAASISAANALIRSDDPRLLLASGDSASVASVTDTLGLTFVAYERTHGGLPVVGGDFVVAVDDAGAVAYTSVAQDVPIALDTLTPAVSPDAAMAVAGDDASAPELVVLAWDDPALSYVSAIETVDEHGAPLIQDVYVDAVTGDVLATIDRTHSGTGNTHYNGQGDTVDFGTTSNGGEYVMEDPDRDGLSCAEDGGSPFTDADDVWGDGTGTDLVTACVDAMYAAATEWDMLNEWLDRDGIDGNGNGFPMYSGLSMVNAYWTGSSAHFGHSSDNQRQLTTMDIVAHELGHGIFQYTPGGSSGGNETGGLNEGAGDIFGALTEWYAAQPNDTAHDPADYLVGEEGGLSSPGVPIRNMADPAALNHPACWSTSIPSTEVHAGAGPINHWFYLLAEGTEPGGPGIPGSTTCNGTTITNGLGIETAGQIFMGALMSKTSSWTYKAARQSALSFAASSSLFSTCAEYNATKAAFDAIEAPTTGDPTCDKGGEPGAPSASFTVDCDDASLTCSFDATASTGDALAWAWDFGDGSTGTGATMDHEYAEGTYTVTLTVTDSSDQSDTATQSVTLGTDPGLCGGAETVNSGTLDGSGDQVVYAYTAVAGVHEGCLDGPDGVDFDLKLEKQSGSSWITVARSISTGADESISYTGTAGEYRWVVYSYRGSGDFVAGFTNP